MRFIDDFLNSITMYRLVLYGLILVAATGILLHGFDYLLALAILLTVCLGANFVFVKIFRAIPNLESSAITALILFLIFDPNDKLVLILAGMIAIASKYFLAIHKKHVFNPAAIAAVFLGANWWVGSTVMLPATTTVGLLVVRKLRKEYMFLAFMTIAVLFAPGDKLSIFLSWPLIFLGSIMLTEPLTTPPTRFLQISYGILVGLLFSVATPELALLIGNVFSYLGSNKQKLLLTLEDKIKLAPNIWDFIFHTNQKLDFLAGQYLEWTLPIEKPDDRGNRRYFTIASSPTEENIHVGVKLPEGKTSSFKQSLTGMQIGDGVVASQLAGDFTLSKDQTQKLVFIAGGIGITPFRSMIKYLIDTKQKRDIVLFYQANSDNEFVYQNVFNTYNIKTTYFTRRLTASDILEYKNRLFYLSGPNAMVESYKTLLLSLNIPRNRIITDYFPGY